MTHMPTWINLWLTQRQIKLNNTKKKAWSFHTTKSLFSSLPYLSKWTDSTNYVSQLCNTTCSCSLHYLIHYHTLSIFFLLNVIQMRQLLSTCKTLSYPKILPLPFLEVSNSLLICLLVLQVFFKAFCLYCIKDYFYKVKILLLHILKNNVKSKN